MKRIINVLFLDDDDTRLFYFKEAIAHSGLKCNVVHVDSARECIHHLRDRIFDVMFLDHDLGNRVYVSENDPNTGSEVARWIEANTGGKNNGIPCFVHSFNPAGAQYMVGIIPNSVHIPGVFAKDNFIGSAAHETMRKIALDVEG